MDGISQNRYVFDQTDNVNEYLNPLFGTIVTAHDHGHNVTSY
jgi:hypothetical protein